MSTSDRRSGVRILMWCVVALALIALAVDHWIHTFGLFPYLLLLACPLMYLMHTGHRGHSSHRASTVEAPHPLDSPGTPREGGVT